VLADLRVLDLSVWRPGPYATQLLAELGADVLKVEPPGGDPMRTYPELFLSLNANKRSVLIDLKAASGRSRAMELAADADVVVEGFRPGVADRLGVGYASVREINPSVIYCSISGLGQTGPLAAAPGHDLDYQAWAGVLAPDGGPPIVPAIPVADLAGGMAAALAICAAFVGRRGTGQGERIDVAMSDVLATWTGAVRPRAIGTETGVSGVPGYGTFETADGGHIALGVLTEDHFWSSLCDALEMQSERDLRFSERSGRVAELQELVAAAVSRRYRDELVAALLARDVPVAPVLSRSEMLEQRHFRERGVVTADPWSNPAMGYPVRLELHPASRTSRPPRLDEHHGAGFKPRAPLT
jgi:crotonobetainyl-CoA:carnitine CoA-transferase CaiB-like acyl-CoA transferase